VLNAEEYEARGEAKQIIDRANEDAARIVQDAEARRGEVFAKAREEAKAEVMAQAAAELAKAKMQAGQIVAAAENDILELACKVAEKIIGHDLQRDPALVVDICANAIESVRNAKAFVMRVNPRDGMMLRKEKPRLIEAIGRTVDLAIKDDADVRPGGCVIQTEFGTIDAQLSTQFEMLKLVLVPDTAKKEVK
jgi:type III secretion protein L